MKPLLIACTLAAAAPAQERLATVGRFVDLDGRPVAGGEVTFATSPVRVHDAFAAPELVRATTGADGRFRALLRQGAAYSAWAVGPADEPRPARTGVLEGVLAGSVLELAAGIRSEQRRLHVGGLSSLGAGGPFTLRLRIDARHGPELALPVGADGDVALPPLPEAQLCARLADAQGRVRVGSLFVGGGQATVAPGRTVRFAVTDELGRPLAGASVAWVAADLVGHGAEPFAQLRSVDALVASAPTDAEGRTELTVHEQAPYFVAWAPGRAQGVTGRLGGQWVQDGEFVFGDARADRESPAVLSFRLAPAPPLRGRLHRAGEPLAGAGVQLAAQVRVTGKQWGATLASSFRQTWTTRTGDDGRFQFDSVPQRTGCLQLACAPTRPGEPPVLLLPRKAVPEAPLDVDLARWPQTTLQVLDAAGGPPASARVVLWPWDVDLPADDPVVLPADRAGRVRARCEPGAWFAFATDGEGWAAQRLVVAADAQPMAALRLAPLARMAGVARGADGSPLIRARFQFDGLETQPGTNEPEGVAARLCRHGLAINQGLITGASTDGDGRFVLRFLPIDGVRVSGSLCAPGSPRVVLEPREDLELRLAQ